MFQRLCSHPGCSRVHDANGYCTTHNSRIRTHGDPYGKRCETCARPLEEVFTVIRKQRYCGDGCKPRCAFASCDRPARKVGLCTSHYAQARAGIDLREVREWAPLGMPCMFCDAPVPRGSGSRRFCSGRCGRLWYLWDGDRPASRMCAGCDTPIDLLEVLPSGKRRPASTRLCRPCRGRHRFGVSVADLAARDGTDCSICGEGIDMALRRPDSLFGPSIDHRIPRARGGSDDPSNLALAHYWCNAVKSDREDFTLLAS